MVETHRSAATEGERDLNFRKVGPQTQPNTREFFGQKRQAIPDGRFGVAKGGEGVGQMTLTGCRQQGAQAGQDLVGQHAAHFVGDPRQEEKPAAADDDLKPRGAADGVGQPVRPFGQQRLFALGGAQGDAQTA